MKILQAVRTTWTDTNTGEDVEHGIKVRVEGHKGWKHLAYDGKPVWFKDPKERDEYLKALKQREGI